MPNFAANLKTPRVNPDWATLRVLSASMQNVCGPESAGGRGAVGMRMGLGAAREVGRLRERGPPPA